jgi:glycosyltransferase EpsF
MLAQHDLSDRVILLGRRNDIYELMAMADVMILPSLYEGLPTVAIEAQAMGLRSLIADTITQECDMGLGLTRFLPIDNGADCWAEAIENLQSMERTPRQTIEQVLSEKGYTDSGAVQRYISVLNRKIAEK